MEVILAEHLGFCYGVKRAIEIARQNASSDGTSSTLGPIIHNPQMVERLKKEGVGTVGSLDEMEDGLVIIRSHGVGPNVYEEAESRGLEVVDATDREARHCLPDNVLGREVSEHRVVSFGKVA